MTEIIVQLTRCVNARSPSLLVFPIPITIANQLASIENSMSVQRLTHYVDPIIFDENDPRPSRVSAADTDADASVNYFGMNGLCWIVIIPKNAEIINEKKNQ